MNAVNMRSNREARKYSAAEMCRRVLWMFAGPLFRWSPRPCFGWRRFLLRAFGAKVGAQVNVYGSATIYYPWNLEIGALSSIGEHAMIYNLGSIRIGSQVTVSQRAHLCAGTHDFEQPDFPLLKPPIEVGDQSWICADAFVGPGVKIGEGAVVGARAVVVKDVEPWTVVAGNPARVIRQRQLRGGKPA
jgi:putative colanic acid biosynthesis acetyltransferase WcaF